MSFRTWSPGTSHFPGAGAAADLKSAALARNWWAVAARGGLAILFGGLVLALQGAALAAFVLLFAAYALLDGIFAVVSAVRAAHHHARWGLLVFVGIANLAAAAVAVLFPLATLLALMILIAAWAIVTGALEFVAALQLNIDHGRVWMVIGGLASVVFGVAVLFAPLLGAIVLTWWIGAFALVSGVASLILAIRLRVHRHDDARASAGPALA
ncbi:MAG: HdeD family acid-resistance protein [Caulobacteraceae bacterium]